ncbi:hypothetical protein [Vibrio alginolyticus]|uniref:hypothetical protein n=1 Tax=Vibrio TaxID=662 RepID=UPI0006CA7471|nr:hypothetical protein [Vibrio alginolyticus]KPM98536.1 hypothetical protein AOG25_08835 [Vibrio alginolyticus]CAH7150384.1 conserved hypothetical protein [Vibrio chagasii]CAH7321300.1 conserved hypothetical protein [Vibrio chagasii]
MKPLIFSFCPKQNTAYDYILEALKQYAELHSTHYFETGSVESLLSHVSNQIKQSAHTDFWALAAVGLLYEMTCKQSQVKPEYEQFAVLALRADPLKSSKEREKYHSIIRAYFSDSSQLYQVGSVCKSA